MVAYSFRPQFEDSILSGRKRQTIRAIGRRRHAQAGDALQLYTGMRTSACRLLARSVCKSTHEVSIVFSGDGIDDNVWLHGIRFGDLTGFAQADGFKAWPGLRAFWLASHPKEVAAGQFTGVLIRWGDLA